LTRWSRSDARRVVGFYASSGMQMNVDTGRWLYRAYAR
jgi:hypothetical protein